MSRAAPLVVIVLVVVFAGCSTTVGKGTPSSTPDDRTLAPGLTADGVTAPAALAEANERVLQGNSYTVVSEVTVRDANGTVLGEARTETRHGRDHGHYHQIYTSEGDLNATDRFSAFDVEIWSNGDVTLSAQTYPDGTVKYRKHGQTGVEDYWERVLALFASVETTVDGEVDDRAIPDYRVVSMGPHDDVPLYSQGTNVTLRAVIAPSGLVSEYEVTYEERRDGRTIEVTETVRITDRGSTTVERPPWVDEALEETRSVTNR